MYDDIVGYTFQAENHSPEAILGVLGLTGDNAEEALDALAAIRGINRQDEYSFDSSEFPKVIRDSQLICSDRDWNADAPGHEYRNGECVECGATEPNLYWVIFHGSYTENGPFATREAARDWAFDSTGYGPDDYRILPGNDNWAFTD